MTTTTALTVTVHTETSRGGPETKLVIYDEKGDMLAGGTIGYVDFPAPAPESVTAEYVSRCLRNCGLAHLADLPISITVGATRPRL